MHNGSEVKKPWQSPKLQHLGTLTELVKSGNGKGNISNEGNAGGATTEFRPKT